MDPLFWVPLGFAYPYSKFMSAVFGQLTVALKQLMLELKSLVHATGLPFVNVQPHGADCA